MERINKVLTSLLFVVVVAMSIGLYSVITTRQADAQVWNQPSSFPRQSELWSFSADGANTWFDNGSGNTGHLLVVTRDPAGRLPVLVTTRFLYGLEIHPVVNGVVQSLWVDAFPPANAESTGFGTTVGVTLQPRSYLIMSSHNGGPTGRQLLLSGYWARK